MQGSMCKHLLPGRAPCLKLKLVGTAAPAPFCQLVLQLQSLCVYDPCRLEAQRKTAKQSKEASDAAHVMLSIRQEQT